MEALIFSPGIRLFIFILDQQQNIFAFIECKFILNHRYNKSHIYLYYSSFFLKFSCFFCRDLSVSLNSIHELTSVQDTLKSV